jgi:cold shock CspA family protein
MATQVTKTVEGRAIGAIVRMQTTRAKGFGFIRDAEGNEYFLHRTACIPNALFDELEEGDGVSFKVSDTPKGQKAFDLERATLTAADVRAILAQEEQRGNR